MRDFFGTDRYGFERILMQLLIPGLIAVGPYLWWLYRIHEPIQGRFMILISANKELALFGVAVCAIITGAMLEEVALRVEKQVIDRLNGRHDANQSAVWYDYLRMVSNGAEGLLVLPGYNSSVVARFKFTVSLSLALLVSTAGVCGLILSRQLNLEGVTAWIVPLAMLLGAAYLFFESKDTAQVLHDNRILTLQALKQLPLDYDDPQKKEREDDGVRYCLCYPSAGCCVAFREFRVLDDSTAYWLVEALDRIPPKEPRAWYTRSSCAHISSGEILYYHRSILERLAPPATK